MRYFLYARKSSESEDRQVQSIDDQVNTLKQLARDLNLDIKKIYTESKTAKKPNNRPAFDEMMQRIENGEADGILCWQINRLSRNPVDSGHIQWLLQQGIIKSIRTIDRQYLPDDNALLFSVESGMANQFILDLRKSTKRGMDSKIEKGWFPDLAPLGYLNDKENKTIIKDPRLFPLVRKIWDLMLTGVSSPPQILELANNEWGFRTRKHKRSGGKELSLSGIYRILHNPFYTGHFEWAGNLYQGKHEPMIIWDEFERVQALLGGKDKPKPKTHKFAFTGFIRCGECNCLCTAETKRKQIKSTGEVREYTYYHCTHRKNDYDCSQRKAVKEDDLEHQIEEELAKYTILPEFRGWALEVLNSQNDREIEDRSAIYEIQYKTLAETQKQLDNLTKMRYRDLITDEEFTKERIVLQKQIKDLEKKQHQTESRAEEWLELTEKTFNFATYARYHFLMGSLETKKEIVMALGSNFTIKDGKLNVQANEWFQPIKNDYPALEKEYLRLEPQKTSVNKAQNEAFASLRAQWLRTLNEIRTFFSENPNAEF